MSVQPPRPENFSSSMTSSNEKTSSVLHMRKCGSTRITAFVLIGSSRVSSPPPVVYLHPATFGVLHQTLRTKLNVHTNFSSLTPEQLFGILMDHRQRHGLLPLSLTSISGKLTLSGLGLLVLMMRTEHSRRICI